MSQTYFIDSTLINHNLIILEKFIINPIPDELKENKNIRIKLKNDEKIYSFENCHIDNTKRRRLRVPDDVISWVRSNFPFSTAFFESHFNEQKIGVWKKRDIETFYDALKKEIDKKSNKRIKMDIPGETILLSWENDEIGNYLLLEKGFSITQENATEYLSEKALASVLPYIFTSVANTSASNLTSDGSKCYIIDKTTPWLSVKQYSETSFSHPGLYLLRRKLVNGEYAYYIGKAADIKSRIVKNGDKVAHPDEKYEDNKQYDEIACISINFDDLANLYGNTNKTPKNNPGVKRGSDIDNALYAIEDIAIHTVSMILLGEGKKLDNKQYRNYTTPWINDLFNKKSEG